MNGEIEKLIKEVRQAAYELHVYLGNGLLEKVYENGLRHRPERAGFRVEAQKPLTVYDDDGIVLGAYFVDLVVNGCLLVELKAVKSLEAIAKPLHVNSNGGHGVPALPLYARRHVPPSAGRARTPCAPQYTRAVHAEGFAITSIVSEHVAQLLNYLTITHQPAGLLINFGSYKFETRIVHASSPRSPDLHVNFTSKPLSPRSPDPHD